MYANERLLLHGSFCPEAGLLVGLRGRRSPIASGVREFSISSWSAEGTRNLAVLALFVFGDVKQWRHVASPRMANLAENHQEVNHEELFVDEPFLPTGTNAN